MTSYAECRGDVHYTKDSLVHEFGIFRWGNNGSAFTSTVTPLMAAAIMNNKEMMILLMDSGYSASVHDPLMSVHAVDDRGFSALVYACLFCSPEYLPEILDHQVMKNSLTSVQSNNLLKCGSILETIAFAASFYFVKHEVSQPATASKQFYLQNILVLLRTGYASITHVFLKRIAANENWRQILCETQFLDPFATFFDDGSTCEKLALDHRDCFVVHSGKYSSTLSVIQWSHRTMPYPDVQLRISNSDINLPALLIPCHSFIIAQHSKYFENILIGDGNKSSMCEISLTASDRTVHLMLGWMYHGLDVTNESSVDADLSTDASSHSEKCVNMQEVLDLMLLANELRVCRLQRICEHRICSLLADYAKMGIVTENFAGLFKNICDFAAALNLNVLRSYAAKWKVRMEEDGSAYYFEKVEWYKPTSYESLIQRRQLGCLDHENSDMPFLILILLKYIHEKNITVDSSIPAFLEKFLSTVSGNSKNYFAKSCDVVDILIEAFPIMLSHDNDVTDDGSIGRSEVLKTMSLELESFFNLNKDQRLHMLQSILMLLFNSITELAVFVFDSVDNVSDQSDALFDRMSNKLYWFFKHHVLMDGPRFNSSDKRNFQDLALVCCSESDDAAVPDEMEGAAIVYPVHRAVVACGSEKIQSLLRLKCSNSAGDDRNKGNKPFKLLCSDVESVCLKNFLTFTYCNYVPPVTFYGERVHMMKFNAIAKPSPPTFRNDISGNGWALPYYMHMASFGDEYLLPQSMMKEIEQQLRNLLVTSHHPEEAGQLFVLARSINMHQIALMAAVHFLYGYSDLIVSINLALY